jgi:hypothetical protein
MLVFPVPRVVRSVVLVPYRFVSRKKRANIGMVGFRSALNAAASVRHIRDPQLLYLARYLGKLWFRPIWPFCFISHSHLCYDEVTRTTTPRGPFIPSFDERTSAIGRTAVLISKRSDRSFEEGCQVV